MQKKLEYFDYTLTPSVKVIDAVMASSALPVLFPSYKINGDYYYDGGFCNNCPCNLVNIQNSLAFDLTINGSDTTNFYFLSLLLGMMSVLNKQLNWYILIAL